MLSSYQISKSQQFSFLYRLVSKVIAVGHAQLMRMMRSVLLCVYKIPVVYELFKAGKGGMINNPLCLVFQR